MELSRNITVIPARKRVGNTAAAEQRPKLKVAAYCRVSTDSEEQASSYEVAGGALYAIYPEEFGMGAGRDLCR